MNGLDIVTSREAADWVRADYNDPVLEELIQVSYDYASGAIDGFDEKTKSAKFKRKLKLFMQNAIVSMYDDRGMIGGAAGESKEHKVKFINQSIFIQLQYGTYAETDL
ncbi:hypothetical protein [Anaerotignum sp. MB30-C6]|uniref:hypothetical protein n=1 Tax=Anaerotignum sp. MB30-C6 TaxID=3070814 RepID=UPI0027DB61BA|nr:hypothetical protein [Anaerotignum sp. MB30-C6]WMI80907.1 hypothetical protein RBQ60_13970 [Anaerotignum sp. MB30-C6]